MAWIFTSDGNYVNFNGGGNLWRLHKDSACISWHWDESGDLFFDVYDQEYYVKAGNIADVVINGTPLSAASGFPAAIQAVFTGLYSPSGAAGLVLKATPVTLTDAQIKALPTTPIQVIPPAGEGKAIVLTNGFLKFTNAGDYTNVTSNVLILQTDSTPFNVKQLSFKYVGFGDSEPLSYGITTPFGDANYLLPDMCDNVGIVIASQNTGDFTDGNAANTITITVYYVVVDL